ncbi:MAG: translation initiation factor IF-2 [Candidatus Magasanikbacteria bacterium CG_4_10_14_0_8_um_filter_32_14]|uniref:Translation initiation factor IF-2 n=1 Tax=Candidatus Magasanikbacteria bacterium CG_4_10_14_0_8_um_filter_32_14 TaxID=1974640 RepID=A0A2M7R9Y1_9BACT|nr:MAG: translation initiation factor IF-2 [Candidatus Magasanikbacteria bacterium CG_4_10_14_0_8_um_filter_32_14]
MNVTELARKLRINTAELLEVLPQYGFDIGKKAIKIDDATAEQVVRRWKYIKRELEQKKKEEMEEKKLKEKELRKELGQDVTLFEKMTVRGFAERLNMTTTQVITELMKNGILANQNQNLDYDTMAIMAEDLGFTVHKEDGNQEEIKKEEERIQNLEEALSKAKNLQPRAPVVVVMGHVDHGKTRLLDTIRHTNIIDTEAGGITQHIGAYQTIWKDPKNKKERALTFIDTPGHEAFAMMRSRGAKVADIAILIVAADDSVKPQTEEAINIIKAAKLPFVVAINKIDKEGADIQKTKTDLSTKGVLAEEWGGNVPMVEISAKQNTNIDKLLDVLLLVADMNEDKIQADPDLQAIGTVIESNVDKGMGPVATVLIQSGTLHRGDKLVLNNEIYGKVRAMKNYKGELIDEAGPSVPIQIIGFKIAPEVGDVLDVTRQDTATEINLRKKKSEQTGAERTIIVDNNEDEEEKKKTLNIVVKADVLGSLEAIVSSFEKIRHAEVGVKIIGKGLGNITEDDVKKATASGATVIGFNVNATPLAGSMMREENIQFLQYNIIYDLIDWVKEELGRLLSDEKIITEIGIMKIVAIFRKEKGAMIVGGRIEKGKVTKNVLARVKHEKLDMGSGKITECRLGQSVVKDVHEGMECGVRFEGKPRIEIDDVLEFYTEETKAREIQFL